MNSPLSPYNKGVWSKDPEERAREEQLVQDVAAYGWSGCSMSASSNVPAFEYTAGLMQTYRHPEIIVFGLSPRVMHGMFWTMVNNIELGRDYSAGGLFGGVLESLDCAVKPVHPDQHFLYLGYAMWHRRLLGRTGDLQAVQPVWPDRLGYFTWDAGFDTELVHHQPRLDRPLLNSASC